MARAWWPPGSSARSAGIAARRLATIDTATGLADGGMGAEPERSAARASPEAPMDPRWWSAAPSPAPGASCVPNLAALDSSTGEALAWDPGADGTVYALAAAPAGDVVYAGGSFTHVGGSAEQKLAGIDATTGAVTSFHVSANNRVRSLATAGDLLYVGGEFTKLGGQARLLPAPCSSRPAGSARPGCRRPTAWSARSCRVAIASTSAATSRPWGVRPRPRRRRRSPLGRERERLRDGVAEVPHVRACDRRHARLRGDGRAGRPPARIPARRIDRLGGHGRRRCAGLHLRRRARLHRRALHQPRPHDARRRSGQRTRQRVSSTPGRPARTARSGRWPQIPRRSTWAAPSRGRRD